MNRAKAGRKVSAIVLSLVLLLVGSASAAPKRKPKPKWDPVAECSEKDRYEWRTKDLLTIQKPEWPEENYQDPHEVAVRLGDAWYKERHIRAFAVDPRDSRIMYMSNGAALLRSTDAGCHWDQIFTLDALPSPDRPLTWPQFYIDGITIPEHPEATGRIYLVIGNHYEHLLRYGGGTTWLTGSTLTFGFAASDDGGKSWRMSSFDYRWNHWAPGANYYRQVIAPPSEKDLLYFFTGARELFYRSKDAGRTWEQRFSPIMDVPTVDPLDGQHLWAWGTVSREPIGGGQQGNACVPDQEGAFGGLTCEGGLLESKDGGSSWRAVKSLKERYPQVDGSNLFNGGSLSCRGPSVFHEPGQPASLAIYCLYAVDGSAGVVRSDDGGASWYLLTAPKETMYTIAHGTTADSIIVAGTGGMERYDARLAKFGQYPWVSIAPPGYVHGTCQVGYDNPIIVTRSAAHPMAFLGHYAQGNDAACSDFTWIDVYAGRL